MAGPLRILIASLTPSRHSTRLRILRSGIGPGPPAWPYRYGTGDPAAGFGKTPRDATFPALGRCPVTSARLAARERGTLRTNVRSLFMKSVIIAAALILSPVALMGSAQAQGTVRGAERGIEDGNRAAGPVGGIVGGAVGAATGTVGGVLGVDPDRREDRLERQERREERLERRERLER
jgi:hypothetical protein